MQKRFGSSSGAPLIFPPRKRTGLLILGFVEINKKFERIFEFELHVYIYMYIRELKIVKLSEMINAICNFL